MTIHISENSLDLAHAHLLRFGDTDIFPKPFELAVIDHEWDSIKDFVLDQDLDDWVTGAHRTCLCPKGRYSYRVATQLDPLDSLVFTALVVEIGGDLELFRVPSDLNVVHSWRFAASNDGSLYSKDFNWNSFLDRCRDLCADPKNSYVVVTDIADFFRRIYHHRLEGALSVATDRVEHRRGILKLIKQWTDLASYGIPVGVSASRLLAEVVIDDVDKALLAEGTVYCRYVDDFRIFCTSKGEAYEKLALLAGLLDSNHGLALQSGKTEILSVPAFSEKYLEPHSTTVLRSLAKNYREILDEIGVDDPYEELRLGDLSPEIQAEVKALNLESLMQEQLQKDQIDLGLTTFLLRTLGQLNDASLVNDLIAASETLYPVLRDLVRYLGLLKLPSLSQTESIGHELVNLLDSSVVSHLDYHRMWVLGLFAETAAWGQSNAFQKWSARFSDDFSKRKLILARGRAGQDFWFRQHKNTFSNMDPWSRRAFLFGASCLPADEKKFWYSSVRRRLSVLESAITRWVKTNPIA